MKRTDYKIHIIGAGMSGLIAAKTLESYGYSPVIIEATNRVGGRVKTDVVNGYQLDHGFQVLLDAYPQAQSHLDYNELQLQKFLPGALIYTNGKQHLLGDPLRDLSFLSSALFSPLGSFSDKLKILGLNFQLKKKSLNAVFNEEETTILEYLKNFGFSDKIINSFFKPFFTGIFLEPNLSTSSRMFEFVYKMFGEGLAVLPKSGIQAISDQLKSQLKTTEFIFNTKVSAVNDKEIVLNNGDHIDTHFSIITANAHKLVGNLNDQDVKWKSCYCLYFEVDKRSINKPLIGLIADDNALINNIFFHNSLETCSKGAKELLSVTVVKEHNLDADDLVAQVSDELKAYCNIENAAHLKTYHIPMALPDLDQLQYDISPTETQLKPTIFLAGDHMLNGSLNAAMLSGDRAAKGLVMTLEDGLVVENLTSEYV